MLRRRLRVLGTLAGMKLQIVEAGANGSASTLFSGTRLLRIHFQRVNRAGRHRPHGHGLRSAPHLRRDRAPSSASSIRENRPEHAGDAGSGLASRRACGSSGVRASGTCSSPPCIDLSDPSQAVKPSVPRTQRTRACCPPSAIGRNCACAARPAPGRTWPVLLAA